MEACWNEYRPCQPGLQASVAVVRKFSAFFAGWFIKTNLNQNLTKIIGFVASNPEIASPCDAARSEFQKRPGRVPSSRFVTYDIQI
jgi:hypothetical protein